MPADPLRSACATLAHHPASRTVELLPAAAGVFGITDRGIAAGLLGSGRVDAATAELVRADPRVDPFAPWLAVSVLVAVSPAAIHIFSWDAESGAGAEVARFERARTTAALESADDGRRLTLIDTATGYRLALTATVSRFNAYGSGARSVIAALTPAAAPAR